MGNIREQRREEQCEQVTEEHTILLYLPNISMLCRSSSNAPHEPSVPPIWTNIPPKCHIISHINANIDQIRPHSVTF